MEKELHDYVYKWKAEYPAERSIFAVMFATLQYPTSVEERAAKLAEDIVFFTKASKGGIAIMWEVWEVVVEIVLFLPHDHAWHDVLLDACARLRKEKDLVPPSRANRWFQWSNLPDLGAVAREHLDRQTPDFVGDDEIELSRWKNFQSFLARLSTPEYAMGMFALWQIRDAIEEPQTPGPWMDCKIWVASVWLKHCGSIVLEELNKDFDEDSARLWHPGTLADAADMPVSGMQRWKFWAKRLSELAEDEANSKELRDVSMEALGNLRTSQGTQAERIISNRDESDASHG